MLTSVGKFVTYKICEELGFNQVVRDSGDMGVIVDGFLIRWVKSCAILVYGYFDGRFPLGGKVSY